MIGDYWERHDNEAMFDMHLSAHEERKYSQDICLQGIPCEEPFGNGLSWFHVNNWLDRFSGDCGSVALCKAVMDHSENEDGVGIELIKVYGLSGQYYIEITNHELNEINKNIVVHYCYLDEKKPNLSYCFMGLDINSKNLTDDFSLVKKIFKEYFFKSYIENLSDGVLPFEKMPEDYEDFESMRQKNCD